jgi:hypothetical protein
MPTILDRIGDHNPEMPFLLVFLGFSSSHTSHELHGLGPFARFTVQVYRFTVQTRMARLPDQAALSNGRG